MDRTDATIARLVNDLEPVRRLRAPLRRAGLWLLAVGVPAAILVAMFADLAVFARRAGETELALELAGMLVTGIVAVIAAFHLALPDRSPRWALAPLPAMLLWLWASGYSCWRRWIVASPDGWDPGESALCFAWIVGFGVPLGLSLLVALRRARPMAPLLPAAVGALGSAALAAFLLQFFHPFDVTVLDLGLHVAAVGIVIAAAGGLSRSRRFAG